MDKDVRIAQLEAEVAELKRLLAVALEQIARLSRTSRTSSKPPSSDIIKPPANKSSTDDKSGGKPSVKTPPRKAGGQPGHDKHTRQPFTAQQIDQRFEYQWQDAGDDWLPLDDFYIVQQVELPEKPLVVTEHRFRRYRHRLTGQIINAPVPESLRRQGLLGPRLRAMTAWLKGQCHMSYRPMQAFYRDVLGLNVSTGQLAKVVSQCSEALTQPYDQLSTKLPEQAVVHVDETGHREQRHRRWLWCAVGDGLTVFRVACGRGAEVLEGLLGKDYRGIIGSDFFSAYRRFVREHGALASYCWAHLIREIRYLTTLSDKVLVNWANKLLDQIRPLFRAWHAQDAMAQEQARDAIMGRVRRPPPRSQAQLLAQRIVDYQDAYFRFVTDPRVEPTNNKAERALRHAVIDRRITQGTRGDTGSRWLERFLTIRETCRQREQSLFACLHQAISQHTKGQQVNVLA